MTLIEKINALKSRRQSAVNDAITAHCIEIGENPETYRLTDDEKAAVRALSMRDCGN